MEENKKILDSLSKNILPSEIMSSFVSIKDLNKKKEKKPKKPSFIFILDIFPNRKKKILNPFSDKRKNP